MPETKLSTSQQQTHQARFGGSAYRRSSNFVRKEKRSPRGGDIVDDQHQGEDKQERRSSSSNSHDDDPQPMIVVPSRRRPNTNHNHLDSHTTAVVAMTTPTRLSKSASAPATVTVTPSTPLACPISPSTTTTSSSVVTNSGWSSGTSSNDCNSTSDENSTIGNSTNAPEKKKNVKHVHPKSSSGTPTTSSSVRNSGVVVSPVSPPARQSPGERIGAICNDFLLEQQESAHNSASTTNPFDDDNNNIPTPERTSKNTNDLTEPPLLRNKSRDSPWGKDVAQSRRNIKAEALSTTTNPFANDDDDDEDEGGPESRQVSAFVDSNRTNPFADDDDDDNNNNTTVAASSSSPLPSPPNNTTPTKHRALKSNELAAWLSTTPPSPASSKSHPSSATGTSSSSATPPTVPNTPLSVASKSKVPKTTTTTPPALDDTSVSFTHNDDDDDDDEDDTSLAAVAEEGWGRHDAVTATATTTTAVDMDDPAFLLDSEDDDDDDDASLEAVVEEGWGSRDDVVKDEVGPVDMDTMDDKMEDLETPLFDLSSPASLVTEGESDHPVEPALSPLLDDDLERSIPSWHESSFRNEVESTTPAEPFPAVISNWTRAAAPATVSTIQVNEENPSAASSTTPLAYTKRKLYGGRFYQDPNEAMAVLTVIESKRQYFFQNEMAVTRKEWKQYRQWLRNMMRELVVAEKLVQNSHRAFATYAQTIEAVCRDAFVNDAGEVIQSKKEQAKMEKLRVDTSAKADPGQLPLLDPVIHAFALLKEELDSHVPLMEDNANEATALKLEVERKAKEMEARGEAMSWSRVEAAEENIRETFDRLLQVVMNNDSRMRVLDDAADGPSDRWLAESSYRHAAHLGLLTWKDNRRDFQKLYSDIIDLDNYRRERTKELLLSFLSRRRRLAGSAYGALIPGAQLLKVNAKSKRQEGQAIDDDIKNLMYELSSNTGSDEKTTTQQRIDTPLYDAVDPYGEDAWESSYVSDRRLVSLKVGKEWKAAVLVKTLDQCLHFFVAPSADAPGEEQMHNPFAVRELTQTMANTMSSVVPEFSIHPSNEFQIEVFAHVVELTRTNRSKIFRKREDHICIKFANERAASQWVESLRCEDGKHQNSFGRNVEC